jgi:hypothetical protein
MAPAKQNPGLSGTGSRESDLAGQRVERENNNQIKPEAQASADIPIGAVAKNSNERFELHLRDFGGCRRLALGSPGSRSAMTDSGP